MSSNITITPSATPIPTATIVELTQGSPEWHAYRYSRRNASESAAVLGLSPWMTRYQLWLLKTSRSGTKVTHAMQPGTDMEPLARAAYEARIGFVMQPLVLEAGDYSASLDGMTLDGDLVLEIKCPLRGTRSDLWLDVEAGRYLIITPFKFSTSSWSLAPSSPICGCLMAPEASCMPLREMTLSCRVFRRAGKTFSNT